jgi:hypothetical protein
MSYEQLLQLQIAHSHSIHRLIDSPNWRTRSLCLADIPVTQAIIGLQTFVQHWVEYLRIKAQITQESREPVSKVIFNPVWASPTRRRKGDPCGSPPTWGQA